MLRQPIERKITLQYKQPNGSIIDETYSFQTIGGRRGFIISSKVASRILSMVSSVFVAPSFKDFSNAMNDVFSEEIIEMLYEFVFSDQAQLKCNGERIIDPDNHFMGRPLALMELLYAAMRLNCDDFFTIGSGKLQNLLTTPMFQSILANKELVTPEIQELIDKFSQPID